MEVYTCILLENMLIAPRTHTHTKYEIYCCGTKPEFLGSALLFLTAQPLQASIYIS